MRGIIIKCVLNGRLLFEYLSYETTHRLRMEAVHPRMSKEVKREQPTCPKNHCCPMSREAAAGISRQPTSRSANANEAEITADSMRNFSKTRKTCFIIFHKVFHNATIF